MSWKLDLSVALPPGEGGSLDPSTGLCSVAKGNQTSLLSVGNRIALLQFCSLWFSHCTDLAVECLLCNCHSTGTCDSCPVASICVPLPAVTLGNSAFFSLGCFYVCCMILAINGRTACKCSRIWYWGRYMVHVARMGERRGAYRVLVGRSEGKKPLGKSRYTWEGNIEMDLR